MANLECLLGSDLLPWELFYFQEFLRSFDTTVSTSVLNRKLSFAPDATLWVIARDWYSVLRSLPQEQRGRVFVSLLGIQSPASRMGLVPRHWNPTPRISVTLLAHSPFVYRFYREMENVPPAHLFHLPLPGLLSEPGRVRRDGEFRVGILGALNADSNLGFLMAIAHYVSQFNLPVCFTLPTEGRLKGHLDAMVADLNLQKMFTQLGDGPDYSMDALLYAPVKSEHFIPILLMGGRGVPVLATDVPGIEDLVSDGHDGFIVGVNETKSLGELIIRLAQNSLLRNALGDQLRQSLAKRLPLDRVMDQYEKVFFGKVSHGAAA